MTSRTIFLSLCMSMSLTIHGLHVSSVLADEEFFPFLAISAGDQVNVRAGQSPNFERLCQLKKGDEVIVVGKEYSWYKIQLPLSAKSFVSKDYVQFLGQNAGGVSANDVNIRAGAGTHHTILGQLTKGEQIYIREELDEWYRIEPVAMSYGWVTEKLLAFKSKDVSSYKAGLPPRPFIIEGLPAKNEQRKEEASEQFKQVAEEGAGTEHLGIISVAGSVEPYENEGVDGIYYTIVANGEPVCYIQGVNHILGRFMHNQVKVDGTVNQKLLSKYAHPVIVVLKVRLIL